MNPLKGNGYAFWSGIGNDIPVFLLGLLPAYFHHKCHKCVRWGKHKYNGTPFCAKHHPGGF